MAVQERDQILAPVAAIRGEDLMQLATDERRLTVVCDHRVLAAARSDLVVAHTRDHHVRPAREADPILPAVDVGATGALDEADHSQGIQDHASVVSNDHARRVFISIFDADLIVTSPSDRDVDPRAEDKAVHIVPARVTHRRFNRRISVNVDFDTTRAAQHRVAPSAEFYPLRSGARYDNIFARTEVE